MSRKILAVCALAAALACTKGADRQSATADSLNRDLQMPAADTTAALNDRPTETTTPPPATTATTNPPAATPSRRTPPPARHTNPPANPPSSQANPPAGGTAAAAATLASGATVQTSTNDSISSRSNKVGDVIAANVPQDVKNSAGKVVIPAGATVHYRITAINASENKSDSTGTLTLAVTDVAFGGNTYTLDATPTRVATHLQGRSTNAGDVAKVGAGAAVGAVVGRVLGGSGKGAVIGGVIGGAVGAQRAVETKDRDVVVPAGSDITITLNSSFTPKS